MIVAPSFAASPGFVQSWGLRTVAPREASRARAERTAQVGGLAFIRQVHGATVARFPNDGSPEADGSVTDQKGLFLAIETADCLPVFVVDPVARLVGAAHAGWRGTARRVVRATIREMESLGAVGGRLRAALGPCIGPCCYEVGPDVLHAFGKEARFFSPGAPGKWRFDLRASNRAQLIEAGVDPGHIEDAPWCTKCREDLFHSYRRDGPNAGRMVSFCGWVS